MIAPTVTARDDLARRRRRKAVLAATAGLLTVFGGLGAVAALLSREFDMSWNAFAMDDVSIMLD